MAVVAVSEPGAAVTGLWAMPGRRSEVVQQQTSASPGKGNRDHSSSKGRRNGTVPLGAEFTGTCVSLGEPFISDPLVIPKLTYA